MTKTDFPIIGYRLLLKVPSRYWSIVYDKRGTFLLMILWEKVFCASDTLLYIHTFREDVHLIIIFLQYRITYFTVCIYPHWNIKWRRNSPQRFDLCFLLCWKNKKATCRSSFVSETKRLTTVPLLKWFWTFNCRSYSTNTYPSIIHWDKTCLMQSTKLFS